MKLRGKIKIGILVILLLQSGCGKKESYTNKLISQGKEVSMICNEKIELEKQLFSEDNRIDHPVDLAIDNDYIYVVNQGKNEILCFNRLGELVDSFGSVGQGQGEFTNPESIAISDDYIYVVEKESCRIQKFNKKFEYIDEIKMDQLQKALSIGAYDLAVNDDEVIFLSVIGTNNELTKVYKIEPNGKVVSIGDSLIGSMDVYSNNMYYVQSYMVKQNEYGSGKSFIAYEENNDLKLLTNLPDNYTPTGIKVTDNDIFVLSQSFFQIDRYSKDGAYISTMYCEDATNQTYMQHMAMDQNNFYLTDTKNNKIYVFYPVGE